MGSVGKRKEQAKSGQVKGRLLKIALIIILFISRIPVHAEKKDTSLIFHYGQRPVTVTMQLVSQPRACIIALPGWNLRATDWCEKTRLCRRAREKGMSLILIEMQKSVYLREYYPQTSKDYASYPTRKWLHDYLILTLKQGGFISPSAPLMIMGLSTGGRGAAIMALDFPDTFRAAASLSGDFNPLLEKKDKLMIHSIGPFDNFPERWQGDNNMVLRAAELKVPLFIGHGQADKVCPVIQSKEFAKALQDKNPRLRILTHFPEKMGHDYAYWDSEIDRVLTFFEEYIR
jgi:S-formylglutathione hydrolase FrmB